MDNHHLIDDGWGVQGSKGILYLLQLPADSFISKPCPLVNTQLALEFWDLYVTDYKTMKIRMPQ